MKNIYIILDIPNFLYIKKIGSQEKKKNIMQILSKINYIILIIIIINHLEKKDF